MTQITQVVTTYFPLGEDGKLRMTAAHRAIWSWYEQLRGVGAGPIIIADDGSPAGLMATFFHGLPSRGHQYSLDAGQRLGVGASLNRGFTTAFGRGDLVLYAVDDWMLNAPIDLTPWAEMLEADETIGMIRLGPPHPHLTGTFEHHEGRWIVRLDRHHYAFGHRPALYHRRMFEVYGTFDEGVNAYDCERLYNERYCQQAGPDVVYAIDYPWQHIDSVELGDVEPHG